MHSTMKGASVFDIPTITEGEVFQTLFEHKNVTIERIVSSGKQPPVKYLQEQDEWVLLLSGQAEMALAGQPISLEAGDTLHLPGGVEHEVLRTSAGATWLAVHVK